MSHLFVLKVNELVKRSRHLELNGFRVGDDVEIIQTDSSSMMGKVSSVNRSYGIVYDKGNTHNVSVASYKVRLNEVCSETLTLFLYSCL